MRVLIIEDDAGVGDLLVRAVRDAAWAADLAPTGAAGLEALAVAEYDLAILDLGLPDLDGFEVCRRWRAQGGTTPILVLTARDGLDDRVRGLDAGADDYLAKPFEVPELMARLRALARRPHPMLQPTLRYLDLALDPNTRQVERAGAAVTLTNREYALLEYLARSPDRILSRAAIIEHVWDDNFDPVGNVVDVLIGRVRRKIDRPGLVPLIHTVRGVGYQFGDRGSDGP